MKLKHIVSARQFDKKALQSIFTITDKIKAGQYKKDILSGKILATLFYEPSTRTRLSFESAMLRLGGKIISTENAHQFSSVAKGETLEDTIRIISFFSDVIVLRHPERGASEQAAKFATVPVINGGDGNGEHPTQAIYDLYTIFSKFKNQNFTVTMMGDLKNGRTIHSLSRLLALYGKIKQVFVSPLPLAIPEDLKNELKVAKIDYQEMEDFEKGVSQADVVYQTRIQKERFKNEKEYKKYFGKYIIDKDSLKIIKKKAIIMHPLPRINEIAPEVDSDPRAAYFQEAQNGLYVRMALLLSVFDKS